MQYFHVPDYLILPYGKAVKSDLQKIKLSAVSADGLYFSTDVPVIFIRKSDKRPMCIGDFERVFDSFFSVRRRSSDAQSHLHYSQVA